MKFGGNLCLVFHSNLISKCSIQISLSLLHCIMVNDLFSLPPCKMGCTKELNVNVLLYFDGKCQFTSAGHCQDFYLMEPIL